METIADPAAFPNAAFKTETADVEGADLKPLAISLYIPFCLKRCGYCDALVHDRPAVSLVQGYTGALLAEIDALANDLAEYRVTTIDVCGGSPSLLGGRVLRELLEFVHRRLNVDPGCETTLELAPVNVNISMFEALARCGVDRLEFEQETFDAFQSEMLAKGFTPGALEDAVPVAKGSRFTDFGVSLLYGLPGQGVPSLETGVNMCAELGATHVKFAPLRLTPGTTVREERDRQLASDTPRSPRRVFPDDEKVATLYRAGVELLESRGFKRYTQFHFAKEGFEARLVRGGCAAVDSVGFGLGAVSRYDGVMCRNSSDMGVYLAHSADYTKVLAESKELSAAEVARDALACGLFAVEGVARRAFEERHGMAPESCLPNGGLPEGWLETDAGTGRIRLTLEGGRHYEEVRDAILRTTGTPKGTEGLAEAGVERPAEAIPQSKMC